MGKMNTAERVSREMSDNFVFQRSLLAYHAAAQRIGGDVLEIGTGAGYGIEVVAPHARSFITVDKFAPAAELQGSVAVTHDRSRSVVRNDREGGRCAARDRTPRA